MIEKPKPLTKPPATLASAVKAAREGRNWTQGDIGKRCGFSPPEVCRMLNGAKATLSGVKILRLARAFAETSPGTPMFDEPSSYEEWVALLTELDAKGRMVHRPPRTTPKARKSRAA